jgi:hypothetical protein
MEKLFTYALAISVSLGTTAVLANSSRSAQRNSGEDARLAVDGAFRDGLYVGRFTAESGRQPHPPTPPLGDPNRPRFVRGRLPARLRRLSCQREDEWTGKSRVIVIARQFARGNS